MSPPRTRIPHEHARVHTHTHTHTRARRPVNKRPLLQRLAALALALLVWGGAMAPLPAAYGAGAEPAAIKTGRSPARQADVLPAHERHEAVAAELVARAGHVQRLYDRETTMDTVVYANRDGTETAYIFDEPVKYIDEQGRLADKSNALYAAEEKGYAYVNSHNDIRTSFPAVISGARGILLRYENTRIELRPHGGKAAPARTAPAPDGAQYVYYDGVFGAHTSLRYTPTFSGFKEDIVLNENVGSRFAFVLKCGDLVPVAEGGGISLYHPAKKEAVATLGGIYVYDSYEGQSDTFAHESRDNHMTLQPLPGGDYLVTVTVDEAFLSHPETVYPVYVDPTVTIHSSGTGTNKLIMDTPIYNGSGVYGRTAGSDASAIIGYAGTQGGVDYGKGRLLMKFPGLMNQWFMKSYQYDITSATLYLKETSGSSTGAYVAVYTYNGPNWTETTKYSAAVWDGMGKKLSSYKYAHPNATLGAFNITEAVKLWQSMPAMGQKGIILKNTHSEVGAMYRKTVSTTEGSGTNKPYLSVNYVNRTAAPNAFLTYGVASPTIKIRLIGATTTSAPWSSIIESSRKAWNNSGAGVSITTTTSGSSAHTLVVDYFPKEKWYGQNSADVLGGRIIKSEIQINLSKLDREGASTAFCRSVVAHEIGHLFWLKDNPYPSTDLNKFASLMSYSRDRNIVTGPQMADIFHVRTKYK